MSNDTTTGTRLSLPGKAKPSKVASKDQTRPVLCHPWVTDVNGQRSLCATDSFSLVAIPVPDDTPIGPIHVDAVKATEAGKSVTTVDGTGARVKSGDAVSEYPAPNADANLPNVDVLLPPAPSGGERMVRIALNPTFLLKVAQGLGVDARDGVRLDVLVNKDHTTLKAIKVTARDRDGFGLVMPIRVIV